MAGFAGICCTMREARDKLYERFPVLSDHEKRSKWGLKAMLVFLHVLFIGMIFVLDPDLVRATRETPWYTAIYVALALITLAQYFFVAGSSPGYVIDAMRAGNEMHATFVNTNTIPKQSTSKNGSLQRVNSRTSSSQWFQIVTDLYPPSSSSREWTCSYCHVIQPPRAKHCHDCDKCVLQFDHHCVWLGTCIGQKNHRRFWWYILVQTILCAWTVFLYIKFIHSDTHQDLWEKFVGVPMLGFLIFILIFLLLLFTFHSYLVMTNQTTFEVARRKRIHYMRGIPDKVRPFSKGICKNLYEFCCSKIDKYILEPIPPMEELQAKARPYTCLDCITCRCC